MTRMFVTRGFGHQLRALDRWAWARHQNSLSWYIRPFFMLPLAYFSYRRSLRGITCTLIATLSSMFWFPQPKSVDPRVANFLQMERTYLAGPWTPTRILSAPVLPISLAAFCGAFWYRSVRWGLVVFNVVWLTKVAWSLKYGKDSGRAILPPAVVGLVGCNAALAGAHALSVRRGQGTRAERRSLRS